MTFDSLQTHLRHVDLQQFGWNSQKKAAPETRNELSNVEIQRCKPKLAAILILIYRKNDSWYFVLTERHEYEGKHSAEISFPGGKIEFYDEHLAQTALRECNEELGTSFSVHESIIPLNSLYIPPSNFLVFPFVHIINEELEFVPQISEVKNIVEVDLQHFILHSKLEMVSIDKYSSSFQTPAFIIQQNVVWGATAMILSEFKDILCSNPTFISTKS